MTAAASAVSDAWNAGLHRVIAFRIAGAGLLEAPPRNIDGIRNRMPWHAILRVVLLVGIWTVVIPGLLSWGLIGAKIVSPMTQAQSNGLLVSTLISFFVLAAGAIAFAAAGRHIDRADAFLNDRLRGEIAVWIRSLFVHHWVGWLVAILIAGALWLWVPEVRACWPANVGSWVSLAEMVLILGTVGYFAGMLPRVTPRLTYASPSDLNVFRLDPAATPAIRLLVEMTSIGGLLLLAVLIFQTVVWYIVQQFAAPTVPVTVAFLAGFMIVIAGIINATVVPTVQLHSWIVRQKLELLSTLDAKLREFDDKPRPTGRNAEKQLAADSIERATVVEEFFHITAVENGPFRSSAMVQFGAAVVGSAVAYAFVLIFGDPSNS